MNIFEASANSHVRGKPFTHYVTRAFIPQRIQGIKAIIVKHTDGWFIVANSNADDDDAFTDLGPFPTPELACVTLRIAQD